MGFRCCLIPLCLLVGARGALVVTVSPNPLIRSPHVPLARVLRAPKPVASLVPELALPADLDALDLFLISPLLVPVLALAAFSLSGGAAQAALDKASAEAAAKKAARLQKSAEDNVAVLEKQLVEAAAKLDRKVAFFENKLDEQSAKSTEALRESKVRAVAHEQQHGGT